MPAYNEEKFIAETLNGMPPYVHRIYVVDDASTDTTRQVIESIKDPRICVLGNSYNQGIGAAIVSGYKKL